MSSLNELNEFIKLVISEHARSFHGGKFNFNAFKKLVTHEDEECYENALEYAQNNLEMIGVGSSRIVFLFSGTKVLKIALNDKGLGQNEQEVKVYTNPSTAPIVTKIYDSDKHYYWLLSELTKPLRSEEEFAKYSGVDKRVMDMSSFCRSAMFGSYDKIAEKFNDDKDILKFARAIGNLTAKNDLIIGDIRKPDSWGVTADGRLVMLDYGFSFGVRDQFYSDF